MTTPNIDRIVVGFSLLSQNPFPKDKSYFIITDAQVAPLWLTDLERALDGALVHVKILPPGEGIKSLLSYLDVVQWLVAQGCHRDSCLIALGGGVITDFVGFVASTLYRGIPFYSIPTTLLAMVDACVGHKNALNVGHLKNIVGTFYPPQSVLCSLGTLHSLAQDVYVEGLSEVLKIGLLASDDYFAWCERHWKAILERDETVLKHLVTTAIGLKQSIVSADLKENGQRAILNLGHTLAHAIEAAADYKISHGAAVSIGLCFALSVSEQTQGMDKRIRERLTSCLVAAGLPVSLPSHLSIPLLLEKMGFDKKTRVDGLHFIMLKGVSEPLIATVHSDKLAQYLHHFAGR